jgi:hypothetical protein
LGIISGVCVVPRPSLNIFPKPILMEGEREMPFTQETTAMMTMVIQMTFETILYNCMQELYAGKFMKIRSFKSAKEATSQTKIRYLDYIFRDTINLLAG